MIDREKLMKQLLKEFLKEDKDDPFIDRDYVEETKRIYKLLMVPEGMTQHLNIDRAVYDIVADILRYFGKVHFHVDLPHKSKGEQNER